MPRINLKHLSTSQHPTLERGNFSIFNDPAVRRAPTYMMTDYVDLDGVVLTSTHLAAFNVAHLGEARVKTGSPVVDKASMVTKNDFFDIDQQYDATRVGLAKYVPGFAFLELPGGSKLWVIGILNRLADVVEAERLRANPSRIRDSYFARVLNKAILDLHTHCRTRMNNIALTTDVMGSLPEYFRLYPEDVVRLSSTITLRIRSLGSAAPYNYTFLYHKYGQQIVLTQPMTLTSTGLSLIVADQRKIDCAGLHLAVNFSHFDDSLALFWDIERVQRCVGGRRARGYPFMGLTEMGNYSCKLPTMGSLPDCWNDSLNVHLTHAQAYTPLIKPLGSYRPFQLHPFLLSYLLGRRHVARTPAMKRVHDSTVGNYDYTALREAIIVQLGLNRARFEVAATSRRLDALLQVDLQRFSRRMRNAALLIELPKVDIVGYSNAVMAELYAPLQSSIQGDLDGNAAIPLILMCETVLAAFYNVTTRDMPYPLLKSYGIAPLKSGAMARDKHLTLCHCARVSRTGILQVPGSLVDRIFVTRAAVERIPSSARREIWLVLAFLEKMKTNDKREIVVKAASILVDQMLDQLVRNRVVPRRSVFVDPLKFTTSGSSVHSVTSALSYVGRAFDVTRVPRTSRLHAFLQVALDLTSEEELLPALARELLKRAKFVPRVVLHGSTIDVAATTFHVLAPRSFESIRNEIRAGVAISSADCGPLLTAVQVSLVQHVHLSGRRSRDITRFSPEVAAVVGNIMRRLPVTVNQRALLGVLSVALVERAKRVGILGSSVSSRRIQRKYHTGLILPMEQLRQILNESEL